VRPIPLDFADGENTEASARKFSVSLSRNETKDVLQEVPKVAGTMINDLLLAALALAFSSWTRSPALLIDLENHGREELFDDIDLARTVGWFTCIFPLLLDLEGTSGPREALQAIKKQVRQIPNGGIGYGLLRYLHEDQQLKALPRAQISFNYVGRFSQSYSESSLFVAAREFAAPSHSPRGVRPYLIEVNGGIDAQGRLEMVFTYSENLHRRSSIERFGEGFVRSLLDIVEQTLLPTAPRSNPSGFLVGDLSQVDLEKLIAELGEIEA
jgi:non-ribosomal peptide synthase protein (TIGR01720 family)